MSNSYKLQLQLARLQAKLERASVLLRESYSADSLQRELKIWSIRASLVAQWVKSRPAVWENHVRSLTWEDPLR